MMESRALLRYILSPWVVGGAITLGVSMFCVSYILLMAGRPARASIPTTTVIVQVIPLPSPTSTMPPPTPSPELTPTLPVPPASGNISIGAFVQVTGTGGDGLRLRSDPGLNGVVRFLGLEAEVFEVSDGPQQVDGYTWWYLIAPYDASIRGWAVANYLVVQNP